MRLQKSNLILLGLILLIVIGFFQVYFLKQPICEGAKLSNGCLNFIKNGAGNNTLILIHGSPGSAGDFKNLQGKISENYTTYAIDFYGFGNSEKYAENYGIEYSAKVLNEFLENQNISRASILGYSWGSGVSINFAYLYPEKTSKLILLSGMGLQEAEPTGSYFLEHLRYLISYPFVVFYPGVFAGDIQIRKGFMRSFMDSDQRTIRGKLKDIKSSTLILHGIKDTVILPEYATKHSELVENSELYFFEGDHITIFNPTEELVTKLNQFLNAHS